MYHEVVATEVRKSVQYEKNNMNPLAFKYFYASHKDKFSK